MKNIKKYLLVSLLAVFAVTAFMFTSSVFSSSELNLKVTYGGNVWDLSKDPSFEDNWTADGDSLSFDVDVGDYYKKLLNQEEDGADGSYEQPFDVDASFDRDEVDDINVSEKKDDAGNFYGVYKVQVNTSVDNEGSLDIALDFEGNDWDIPTEQNPYEFSILKDKTDPEIVLEGIGNGDVFHDETPVELEVEIDEENIEDKEIQWTHNGKKVNSDVEWDENKAEVKFEEDGNYAVTITAEDTAGNKATEELSFFVHNEDPQWNVTNDDGDIESGDVVNDNSLDIGIENGIDIESAEVMVKKDNEEVGEVDLAIDGKKATGTFTFNGEGDYTLDGTIVDAEGGKEHSLTFDVTIDRTVPEVVIEDNDGEIVNKSNMMIHFTYSLTRKITI